MAVDYPKPAPCPHCGMYHNTTCPRIRAIEYHSNGSVKRVEFHSAPIVGTAMNVPQSEWTQEKIKEVADKQQAELNRQRMASNLSPFQS